MSAPFFSLIIPAYNEERRLAGTLDKVFDFFDRQTFSYEVLVVENGSHDQTLSVAQSFQAAHPQLRVLQSAERGKGLAVKLGMLSASGTYRFMCDADLSMPIEQVLRFIPPQMADSQVAIASREAPGAVRYGEPQHRHVIGRGYNLLIQLLALPGLRDTQCGFKCFRGDIAERLFSMQTMAGWAFDIEVLFIARRLGYPVVEVPIPWYYDPDSKVRVLHDSVRMGIDLLRIRWQAMLGRYNGAGA